MFVSVTKNPDPEIAYQRLSSRFKLILGATRGSLWLGPDHLLKIRNFGFSEEYRRYYLKEIQAITLTQNRAWLQWALLWSVLILIFALICFNIGGASGITTAFFTVLPFSLFLLIDLAKGPTCVGRIHTAVQADKVEALDRLRNAQRIIERLHPIIIEAQGGFTAEDMAAMNSATGTSLPEPTGTATDSASAGESDASPAPEEFASTSPESFSGPQPEYLSASLPQPTASQES